MPGYYPTDVIKVIYVNGTDDIGGLRAVAVILTVYFHVRLANVPEVHRR